MKNKKIIVSCLTILLLIILLGNVSFGKSIIDKAVAVPVTDEYKEWESSNKLNLSGYIPKKFDIGTFTSNVWNSNNPYYITGSSAVSDQSKFSLRDVIPNNVVIRNQGKENSCWAFTTIACLESNLALKNKQKGLPNKTYDFSEQYMVSSSFYNNYLNGKVNPNGLDMPKYVGGNFNMRALGNVTCGNGVVDEKDYPYLNSEEPVDINSLSGKNMSADILDTIMFGTPKNDAERLKIRNAVKEHIVNNGGVYVGMKIPGYDVKTFDPIKGAVYNDKSLTPDHAVTIIGWDDNYSKDNFPVKPSKDGAWIAKNSYGDHYDVETNVLKTLTFQESKDEFLAIGINSPNQISDEDFKTFLNQAYQSEYGFQPVSLIRKDDGKNYYSLKFNTEGYIYISYEDKTLNDYNGIVRAREGKDYDNLYQNNYNIVNIVGWDNSNNSQEMDLAEVYSKNSENEKLLKVSIFAGEDADYEFYANLNDSDVNFDKFVKLKLENFDTKIHLNAGYHTIYLEEPLKINGNDFVVAARVTNSPNLHLAVQSNDSKYTGGTVNWFDHFKPTKKSYLAIDAVGKTPKFEVLNDADLALKAYTVNFVDKENKPDDTHSSNPVGGDTKPDDNNKTFPETPKREVTKIEVKNLPNKREYVVNREDLNLYGGDLKVYYSDGSTVVISMSDSGVEVSGFDNSSIGNKKVNVSYDGKVTSFDVLVKVDKESDDVWNPTEDDNTTKPSDKPPIKPGYSSNEYDLRKSTIRDLKVKISENGNVKKIKLYNIKIDDKFKSLNLNYVYSTKLRDSMTKNEIVLEKKSGDKEFKFNTKDLKKDNDGTYYFEYVLKDTDIKNLDDLKKVDLLLVNLRELKNDFSLSDYDSNFSDYDKTVKVELVKDVDKDNKENKSDKFDNTVVKGRLPQTGETIGIFIVIIGVLVIGVVYKVKADKKLK